jgi:hypothetical protein
VALPAEQHATGGLSLNSEETGARATEFATIYPGHGQPMPSTFIGEQITCVESILDGTAKSAPQHFFTGDAMVAKYKTAAVAYNPENLRVQK